MQSNMFKAEGRKFVATLQHQGLVSKKELKVLDRMWAEITEAAIATGAAKKKGAPLLTFTEFTDRLLRLYKVPRDKEIQKTIQNLTDQANSLSTLFKEWQIETLNEVQMRQILLAVDSLCERHERVEAEVQQHVEHQLSLMNKQHIQTLFWDKVGGPLKNNEVVFYIHIYIYIITCVYIYIVHLYKENIHVIKFTNK